MKQVTKYFQKQKQKKKDKAEKNSMATISLKSILEQVTSFFQFFGTNLNNGLHLNRNVDPSKP